MQHYTVQDILALNPCQPTEDEPNAGYPEGKLQHLFGDRQSVTLLEICDDERVPIEDRQWVLHRLLPEQIVHEAACRYAEHALESERAAGCETDHRSLDAIAAKRRWMRGEISRRKLEDSRAAVRVVSAAWYASWDAAKHAASGAAGCSVSAVACAAASGAAVWAAARAAERRWQLDTLRAMIEEMEDRNPQQGETP